MELRQLKYFLDVAEARSITGAANSLYISRQGVSKAIAQLEIDLGVKLFMRDAGGVYLTPAGVILYERVRSNVLELEKIYKEMQCYSPRYKPRFRLAFSIGTIRLFESALLQFSAQQENMEIEYCEYPEEKCVSLLLSNEVDIALCISRAMESTITSTPVFRSPYGVLMQSSERLDKKVTVDELKRVRLAGMYDTQTADLCRQFGLELKYAGYDLYRIFSLTAEGTCAMILPEALAPKNWNSLVWLPIDNSRDWQVYSLVLNSQENSIQYNALRDYLQMQVFPMKRND